METDEDEKRGDVPVGLAEAVLHRELLDPTVADWLELREAGASNRWTDEWFGIAGELAGGRLQIAPSVDDDSAVAARLKGGQLDGGVTPERYRRALIAVLESRLVGVGCRYRLYRQADVRDDTVHPSWLGDLSLPSIDRRFVRQLSTLKLRRASAERPESVDWAVERIVAELYELDLVHLVALQDDVRR